MAEPLVIETAGLCKRHGGGRGGFQGGIDALRGLDLELPAGSICGFLGRNGAGKTTTIKVLLGMAHASAGRARVFGLPVGDVRASVEIRRRTGFVSDDKDRDHRDRRPRADRGAVGQRPFAGELDAAGARLIGTWSQRTVSLPLTFARDEVEQALRASRSRDANLQLRDSTAPGRQCGFWPPSHGSLIRGTAPGSGLGAASGFLP